MKFCADFHLHTFASDGRCSVFEHAQKAVENGLDVIALTDHGFASFVFHMTKGKFERQRKDIENCRGKYPNLRILQGVEANLVNCKGDYDLPSDMTKKCDLIVIGFHRFLGIRRVLNGGKWLLINGYASRKKRERLIEQNTISYINAIEKYTVDIIAHLNHRALVDVKRVCESAKAHGVYIELNEKHIDALAPYAKDIVDSGVNLIVGSDAHSAKRTGKFSKVERFIAEHNIPLDRVFGIEGNLPCFKKRVWQENV